jgi:Tudor domain
MRVSAKYSNFLHSIANLSFSVFYRGTIVEVSADECSVEFIDYGNTQHNTQYDKVYSEVICWEVPPFAQKYRLYGSPMGQDGKINKLLLDMLHQQIVDNSVEIRIAPDEAAIVDPNISKLCWINHNGKLIKTYDDFLVYMEENCYVSA